MFIREPQLPKKNRKNNRRGGGVAVPAVAVPDPDDSPASASSDIARPQSVSLLWLFFTPQALGGPTAGVGRAALGGPACHALGSPTVGVGIFAVAR